MASKMTQKNMALKLKGTNPVDFFLRLVHLVACQQWNCWDTQCMLRASTVNMKQFVFLVGGTLFLIFLQKSEVM